MTDQSNDETESLGSKYEGWLQFHGRQSARSAYLPGSENSAPGLGPLGDYKSPEDRDNVRTLMLNELSMLTFTLERVVLDLVSEVQALKDERRAD